MFKRIICILVLVFSCSIFGQNMVKHTVAAGETIQVIAQKYKVTPYDIYKLNPDSQSGIKVNSVLLIPKSVGKTVAKDDNKSNSKKNSQVSSSDKTHIVVAKETLYSISKKYDISIAFLEAANPFLKTDGLQPGQVLKIIYYEEPPKVATNSKMYTIHEVVAGETKYSISKKYGVSIEDLEKSNPEIVSSLSIGLKLKVEKTALKAENQKDTEENSKPKVISNTDTNTIEYTVKAGETLYSLTKMFNMSQDRLILFNPELNNGVREGMVLNLPKMAVFAQKKEYFDLSKTINTTKRKKLTILLPFNADKIENDTINSIIGTFKKINF